MAAGVVLLSGCATVPPAVHHPHAAWRVHRRALASIRTFALRAAVAIRAGGHGGSLHLRWREQPAAMEMEGFGPLGDTVFRLHTGPNGAVLVTGKGRYRAASPDGLLSRMTGWRLPVGGLRYWILGEPRPAIRATYVLDRAGFLGTLHQAGWVVAYRRYRRTPLGRLPVRLDLARAAGPRTPALHIRIDVSHWSRGRT